MAFFIYTLIIGMVGYGIQMNAYESIGITFFVVMEFAGVIVHIMRKPNPQGKIIPQENVLYSLSAFLRIQSYSVYQNVPIRTITSTDADSRLQYGSIRRDRSGN